MTQARPPTRDPYHSHRFPLRQAWDSLAMRRLVDPDEDGSGTGFLPNSMEAVRLAMTSVTLYVFWMAEVWWRSGRLGDLEQALLSLACATGTTKSHCWTPETFDRLLDMDPTCLDLPRVRQLHAKSGCFTFAEGDQGYLKLGRVVRFCDVFVPLMLPTYEASLSSLSMHGIERLRKRNDRATERVHGLLWELDSRESAGEDAVLELVEGALGRIGDGCDPLCGVS